MSEPRISRELSIFLIKRFIKDEKIKSFKGTDWGKEIKIIGQCYLSYPNEIFWKNLNLGFLLNSFAFFKTPDGKNELEKHWRLYNFDQKIDGLNKNVDKSDKLTMIKEKTEEAKSFINSELNFNN